MVKEKLYPIYLLSGVDHSEIKTKVKQIEKSIGVDQQSVDLITFFADETDLGVILSECETYPVFSEKKVVKIYDCDKLDKKKLASFLENPSDSTILILISSKNEKEIAKEIVQAVRKKGYIEFFQEKYANEAVHLLRKELEQLKIQFDPEALQYLVEKEENTVGNIHNLVELIRIYCSNNKKLTVEAVSDILVSSKMPSIFEFIDTLFTKEITKSLRLFHQMISEDENYGQIVFMLFRQLKLIWSIRGFLNQRLPQQEIFKRVGIPAFIGQKLVKQANLFNFDQLENLIDNLAQLDFFIKSGEKSLIPTQFELYISQFK